MTKLVEIPQMEWVEVGTGPMFVEKPSGEPTVHIHFSEILPQPDELAFHVLDASSSFSYGGSLKCYARSPINRSVVVVTEVS